MVIERVSADGTQVIQSTGLIEIPDSGDYITAFDTGSTKAKWIWYNNPSEDVDITYSHNDGRVFDENERLYIHLPAVDDEQWGTEDETGYRLVLYKSDESTKTIVNLTEDSSSNSKRVFSGTIPRESYRGNAGEGVGILPWLASKISFILKPLFGFSSDEAVAVPVTALGSAGAALGLIPGFIGRGLVNVNDLAVFTAICMCWSGYLSTHVSMMEVLECREHTGKAIMSHTIGGLCAGVAAHWLFRLFMLF